MRGLADRVEALGRLARHMRPFVAAAAGGPELYRGRDMRAAHAGLGITDAHFDRTVEHLVGLLRDLAVDDDAIGELGAALEPLRALVVEPGSERMAA
jgi:hemoglobin